MIAVRPPGTAPIAVLPDSTTTVKLDSRLKISTSAPVINSEDLDEAEWESTGTTAVPTPSIYSDIWS